MTSQGKKSVPDLIVYWFVNSNEVVPSQLGRMLVDSWNRLLHGRADRWAYVLLQTGSVDGDTAALGRMQAVLNDALPAFQVVGAGS